LRERVKLPEIRPIPENFLKIVGAHLRNLKNIDITIPLERFTVISGLSGSGKTTLVKDVLVESLLKKHPIGCKNIEVPSIKPVLVDQDPIGRNPRSNPATYTKLSDIIRNSYSKATGLSISHFSFNTEEGACPTCKGMGAIETKMRYLPSTWITCSDCDGERFSDQILSKKVAFGEFDLSVSDFYKLSVEDALPLLSNSKYLSQNDKNKAKRIVWIKDIGIVKDNGSCKMPFQKTILRIKQKKINIKGIAIPGDPIHK